MDKQIVTYSKAMNIVLTRLCRNNCAYCGFHNNEEHMQVPYALIKIAKRLRILNVKEAYIVAGERPDRSNAIRAKLDQWGFESYADYIYTICELTFLEGLLPNIDVGYLTEEEIMKLRRICTSMTIMLECGDQHYLDTVAHKNSPDKTIKQRLKSIVLTGKAKVPVTTGIIVGMGESVKSRLDALKLIASVHKKYGHIQNVMLQNFVPYPNTSLAHLKGPTKKDMLDAVAAAKKVLPEDIIISVPLNLNPDYVSFVKAGVRDFGHISTDYDVLAPDVSWPDLKKVELDLKKIGFGLQRRLPIFAKYVKDNWYSRKLGQMLDKYRMLLKQAEDSVSLKAGSQEDTGNEKQNRKSLKPVKIKKKVH